MAEEFSKVKSSTTWNDLYLSMGATGVGGIMGTTLDDLGSIDDSGVSIEVADGQSYELIDINGLLLDKLQKEPKLSVKLTLVNPTEAVKAKFWDAEVSGTGEARKFRVKSLVTATKYSMKFGSKDPGTDTFEVPFCSVNMKPKFEVAKGWLCECTFDLLKGQAGYLFDIGTVPTPVSE